MVQIEYINIGVSLFGVVTQVIYTYFNKKGFQERFEKYKIEVYNKLREKAKDRLIEINQKIDQKENSNEVIKLSKNLAEELDKSQEPARDYFGAYKNIKWFYFSIFASIIFSLLSLKYPTGKLGEYSYSGLGFLFLIIGIVSLGIIIWVLQKIGERVLAFELGISAEQQ